MTMPSLPITQVLPEVKQTLHANNRLVLQAPPGAGKTTALPLALLDEPWLQGKKIIMLEPRRLAARSSARRMAEMLGEKVGQTIGYQIKMESVQSTSTRILIVTEGILTRKLQADPSLEDAALVIFDEFHERSLHADLALALALESQSLLREELKLLVMSATLNTKAIAKLLGDAPIVTSKGRKFPVESIYLDARTAQPAKKELPAFINTMLQDIIERDEGNILIFLPGTGEIKRLEALLKTSMPNDILIAPLYGNLSKEAQDSAIKAPPKGKRKIVLSTNIAQTSLTIEGIKIVIDSGLHNVSRFNTSSGMNRLETVFISRDAATQRAGRAGRLSEGRAYRLWQKGKILQEHDLPEILQADLTQMVLELALWGNDTVDELAWMDLPPPSAVAHARELLIQLGALDVKGTITPHGKKMSGFGLHPRLAHMVLKAQALEMAYEASLLAVLVTEKDIYRQSTNEADLRQRVIDLHDVASEKIFNANSIDIPQCNYLLQNARRIEKPLNREAETERLGALLSCAYPDRIAQQRSAKTNTYLLANGKGAFLHSEDTLFNSEYLVVADLDGKSQNARIYKAIAITKRQIEEYCSELIEIKESLEWNRTEARVEARDTASIGSIVLESKTRKVTDLSGASTVLLEAIKGLGLDALKWSKEAQGLRQRLHFVALHADTAQFPGIDDSYLLENMHEWLLPYVEGKNSLKSLESLNLHGILLGLLSYDEQKTLDRLAPAKLQVPSGSRIPIDYSDPSQPILAVRLQEMFGAGKTPAIMNGKVKLMLHLLSPAHRPMQVTQDLANFWNNTYDEVKKELRGKYKKHYWPDDPMTAVATNRVKKRM